MKREEAVNRFKGIRESFSISIAQSKFYPSKVILDELCDMAIEALSAEQKEEELANDIARRMATIIENEQDMRVILKNASAEDEQGVGRYENAMQKLRDMPRYLNGVKKKQITKISANYTTEKPNDVVEQGNDAVAEPTDLISREDAIEAVCMNDCGGCRPNECGAYLDKSCDVVKALSALPSADKPTELLDDGTLKVNVKSGAEVNRVLVWGDDGCGGLYYVDDRPSGEWIPCSEKLPEDGQAVIICTDDKRFKNHPVGTCTYEHGRFHTNFHDDISMIAWMPLPKPYCPNCGAKMGSDVK